MNLTKPDAVTCPDRFFRWWGGWSLIWNWLSSLVPYPCIYLCLCSLLTPVLFHSRNYYTLYDRIWRCGLLVRCPCSPAARTAGSWALHAFYNLLGSYMSLHGVVHFGRSQTPVVLLCQLCYLFLLTTQSDRHSDCRKVFWGSLVSFLFWRYLLNPFIFLMRSSEIKFFYLLLTSNQWKMEKKKILIVFQL